MNAGHVLVGLCALGALSACSGKSSGTSDSDAPVLDNPAQQYCFREVHSFPDEPQHQDIEELIVHVTRNVASGQLNWIPWAKDRRLGHFKGRVEGGVIDARYDFEQEGTTDSIRISIRLEDDKAIVSGAAAELGINRTITRVSC